MEKKPVNPWAPPSKREILRNKISDAAPISGAFLTLIAPTALALRSMSPWFAFSVAIGTVGGVEIGRTFYQKLAARAKGPSTRKDRANRLVLAAGRGGVGATAIMLLTHSLVSVAKKQFYDPVPPINKISAALNIKCLTLPSTFTVYDDVNRPFHVRLSSITADEGTTRYYNGDPIPVTQSYRRVLGQGIVAYEVTSDIRKAVLTRQTDFEVALPGAYPDPSCKGRNVILPLLLGPKPPRP